MRWTGNRLKLRRPFISQVISQPWGNGLPTQLRIACLSLFNHNEVKSLAGVAKTLAKAAGSVNGKVTIIVGLNIPDDHSGTEMPITPGTPAEEVARLLAYFIVHVEQIAEAMRAEVEAGRVPFGSAKIELQDDGSLLICWVAQADFSHHELRISSDLKGDASQGSN